MKAGQYITDRYLPGFIEAAAQAHGIAYTAMSDGWVIRLEKGMALRWVLGYQFDVNGAAASAVAQDKVATHDALKQAGVPSVEHILVRALPSQAFPAKQLTSLFTGPFVLKPLGGTGGRGVQKVGNMRDAEKVVSKSGEMAWAASPLYDISAEYRVIMLDGTPLVMYEKKEPVTKHGLRYFNLGKGAVPVDILTEDTSVALETLARQACGALSLRLASVDIVRVNNALRVLEINDGIMMEYYARHNEQYKKNAALAYDAIVITMFR